MGWSTKYPDIYRVYLTWKTRPRFPVRVSESCACAAIPLLGFSMRFRTRSLHSAFLERLGTAAWLKSVYMELSVNGGSKKNSWVIMEKHTKMEDSGVPPFQETFIMYIMYIYIYLIIYIFIYIYYKNTIPINNRWNWVLDVRSTNFWWCFVYSPVIEDRNHAANLRPGWNKRSRRIDNDRQWH